MDAELTHQSWACGEGKGKEIAIGKVNLALTKGWKRDVMMPNEARALMATAV